MYMQNKVKRWVNFTDESVGSREQQWEGSGVQFFLGPGPFLCGASMFSLSLLGSDRHISDC